MNHTTNITIRHGRITITIEGSLFGPGEWEAIRPLDLAAIDCNEELDEIHRTWVDRVSDPATASASEVARNRDEWVEFTKKQ